MNVSQVIEDLRNSYIGNATAHRDYRVQLRGTRSVLMFGIYLVILIAVATITYSITARNYGDSLTAAQESLRAFYQVIMLLLAGMISIITPALAATTVVMERQRRSFDLIFSAPVTPRYYMVGKMVSSFRYTWMLLILALPVTAASVVLGGASWADVLTSYALLSMHALVFTAISLLMSTVAPRPVSAVIWTYAAVGLYLTGGFAAAQTALAPGGMSNGLEMNPLVAMNPFTVVQAAGTYTTLFGIGVPNLLLALLMTLAITKITLLAAGSVISPYGGTEKRSLRAHSLLYLGVLSAAGWYLLGTSTAPSTSPHEFSMIGGAILNFLLLPLCIVMPSMTCYGYDGERSNWPNGLFSFRHILNGTPAGALPYILSLIGVASVGAYVGFSTGAPISLDPVFFAYPLFAAGFWTLMWGIGRAVSFAGKTLKQGRTLQFAAFLATTILPVPFLMAIVGNHQDRMPLWNIFPFYPLTQNDWWRPFQVGAYGLIMLLLGIWAAVRSERKMRPFIRPDLAEDERRYGSAGGSLSTYRPASDAIQDRPEGLPTARGAKGRVDGGISGRFGDDDDKASVTV